MTVFNTGPQAVTANFHPGDTELVYMEVFRAERHTPINMVAETLNLNPSVIARFPKDRPTVAPT